MAIVRSEAFYVNEKSTDISWDRTSDLHINHCATAVPNRNEYREYLLGGKGGRCVRLTTLPPSCVVTKSGSLNFLEPSGTVQACNGIALPYTQDWGMSFRFYHSLKIVQETISDQSRVFPVSVTEAEGQAFQCFAVYPPSLVFLLCQPYVAFSPTAYKKW